MKNPALKYLTPAIAGICLGFLPSSTHAQTTPVFDYGFPASWNGTGTAVTDLSSAGNGGITFGTPTLSSALPSGGTGNSINTSSGAIDTTGVSLLNNAAIAAAGGFTYNIDFMWTGGFSTSRGGVQKLIDYAGTEDLQLVATNSGPAALQMTIGGYSSQAPNVPDPAVVSTYINANTWYDVTLTFNTTGNSLDPLNGIAGVVDLYVNGALVSSAAATKGDYGDSLGRAIGVGGWAADHAFGLNILDFQGDIYNASADLGVAPVPEPSSLALSALGGLGFFGMMWKARRRKV